MDELKDRFEELNKKFDDLIFKANESENLDIKEDLLSRAREIQIEIEDLEPTVSKIEQDEMKEQKLEYERTRL